MRRDHPTTPFDVETDELTHQFWGASKGWLSAEQAAVRRRAERSSRTDRDDTTGSMRVIRDGFAAFRPQISANATGEMRRQRRHGASTPSTSVPASPVRREATLGELAAGLSHVDGRGAAAFDDDYLDDDYLEVRDRTRHSQRELRADDEAGHDVPLTPIQPLVERLGLGAVDPLLVRAGGFLLALVLLVPVMLSLRPDRVDSLPGDVVVAPQAVVAGAAPAPTDAQQTLSDAPAEPGGLVPTATPETVPATEPTQPSPPITEAAVAEPAPSGTASDPAPSESPVDPDAAVVDVVAQRLVPACPQTYTAAPGDSWYRIADEAGVAPDRLLAENRATTDTVILPGDDICLPEGATMPVPPTTLAPAPATSEPATTPSAPTTVATTTPTTTAAPVANLTRSEVQELIRQTWPDEEVETALEIARRESNFIATADNGWCCVGVFQIYWTVHRSWLDDFGITERSDLLDGRKNVAAAYAMWQRSGWGPWGG